MNERKGPGQSKNLVAIAAFHEGMEKHSIFSKVPSLRWGGGIERIRTRNPNMERLHRRLLNHIRS